LPPTIGAGAPLMVIRAPGLKCLALRIRVCPWHARCSLVDLVLQLALLPTIIAVASVMAESQKAHDGLLKCVKDLLFYLIRLIAYISSPVNTMRLRITALARTIRYDKTEKKNYWK